MWYGVIIINVFKPCIIYSYVLIDCIVTMLSKHTHDYIYTHTMIQMSSLILFQRRLSKTASVQSTGFLNNIKKTYTL